MCCIAACYLERLDAETLDAMVLWNRDGVGMAWVENGKVRWQKGLDPVKAHLFIRHLPLPYVVHARLSTVGGDTKQLTHPFPVERGSSTRLKGSANRVLFHNGHVGNWRALVHASDGRRAPILGNKWSDSRAIAHVVASKGKTILDELAGNRFALLTPKGIERFGDGWTLDAGYETVHLSSSVHRHRAYQTAYYGRYEGGYWDNASQKWISKPGSKIIGPWDDDPNAPVGM